MAANWKRSDDVAWEELGNEALLVSPRLGGRWSLNAMASAVWKLCDGSRGTREVAGELAKASGRSLARVRAEVRDFCENLARMGLLTATPAAASGPAAAVCFEGLNAPPALRSLGLMGRGGRRPTPRGNSGPG